MSNAQKNNAADTIAVNTAHLQYTITGRPITKKNSQRIFRNSTTGKPFIKPSQQYENFAESAAYCLRPTPATPIDYPCNVMCVYFMPTRKTCDLVNLLEATLDILVKNNILADDNYRIAASHDGSCVKYDKDNPRTEIIITRK